MHSKYSFGLAALAAGLVSITSASAAPAASFDPYKCAPIQNVDVPYDVTLDGGRIIFNSHGRQIVVAPTYWR
ncbi:MAG: hypothetical protein ACJ8IR_13175 [Alphaproteobacteria bacterium]|jgi:hypothetical protein